jgi:hypothetical protein
MPQQQSGQAVQFDSGGPAPEARWALRIADVCRLTGLGRTSIYSAIAAGDLVARKFGRSTVVLAADLLAFLNKLPSAHEIGCHREKLGLGESDSAHEK